MTSLSVLLLVSVSAFFAYLARMSTDGLDQTSTRDLLPFPTDLQEVGRFEFLTPTIRPSQMLVFCQL